MTIHTRSLHHAGGWVLFEELLCLYLLWVQSCSVWTMATEASDDIFGERFSEMLLNSTVWQWAVAARAAVGNIAFD